MTAGSEGGGPHEQAALLSCPSLVSTASPSPKESGIPITLLFPQQREQDPDQALLLGLNPNYDF